MLVVLRRIELVKQELMHSLETLHMKQVWVLVVFMLMQYVPTTHALTWVVRMHREVQKKVRSVQCG
jgi:hypothetical protein